MEKRKAALEVLVVEAFQLDTPVNLAVLESCQHRVMMCDDLSSDEKDRALLSLELAYRDTRVSNLFPWMDRLQEERIAKLGKN